MKKAVDKIVRYLLPVVLTVLLLWYMFHKVKFREMMEIVSHGVDYWWILAAMFLSIFSHVFRAMRWRLQLRSLNISVPLTSLCCSIFGCYALNLVLPRLGEIWRCTYVSRRGKSSFSTVFGSLVADRLADMVLVLGLFLLAMVVANQEITSFMERYAVGRDMLAILYSPWFWLCVLIVAVVTVFVLRRYSDCGFMLKLKSVGKNLWVGFWAVSKMQGRGWFLFYSILIWGCYYVQLYLAFFAFDFTKTLCAESSLAYGLIPCLVAFVLSSIGMAVPSNGGLGPWNLAIMFGLALYGISDAQGTAFSMVQWTGETVMLVALGIFTMIYIFVDDRRVSNSVVSPESEPVKNKLEH